MDLSDLPTPEREATVDVETLSTDGDNPNEMDGAMFGLLCRNLKRHGWLGGPIIADTDGLIADGEHRWRAAKEVGLDEVPVRFYAIDDTDRRLWRQELNKIRGTHDTKRDALEYDLLLNKGKADDVHRLTQAAGEDLDELLSKIRVPDDTLPRYEYPVDPNVYYMDCIDGMREHLEDNTVDCIITSPPYNVNLGESGDEHLERSGRTYYQDDRTPDEYKAWVETVLTECARVLTPDGHLFWNYMNDYRDGIIQIPAWVPEACPLPFRSYIVWSKDNIARSGIGLNPGRFAPTWEPIFHFSEDPRPLNGSRNWDVWDIRPSSYEHDHDTSRHPAPFSVALAKHAIAAATDPGDLVLDPFMGSGTTAVAAIETDRDYVGFELDEHDAYRPIIERRVTDALRAREHTSTEADPDA